MSSQEKQSDQPVPRRATVMVTVMAVLFIAVPVLFWHDTWFGRGLTDDEITEYLADIDKPRKAQHALAQISNRMGEGDPAAKQWYPRIVELADHPLPELRLTSAWVMGQDPREQPFRRKLRQMLGDPEPLVRRNAALSLAAFEDPGGREILASMLRPFTVASAHSGVLTNRLESGDVVAQDTLLARVAKQGEDEPVEVRSPVPGVVAEKLLEDGVEVSAGDEVMVLSPDAEHAYQALRALYVVGTLEDLDDVRRFFRPTEDISPRVAQQARLTAERIRERASGAY